MRTRRLVFLIAAAAAFPAAAQQIVQQPVQPPQPQVGLPAALEVQRLAPQLVDFAGSQANFNSLVNGLALGSPVTLETVGAGGTRQVVTFTPAGAPMSSLQIAQTLENARQQLIASGIAAPSPQQLAVALTGGQVPLAVQPSQAPAVPPQQAVSPAAEVQSRTSAGATAPFSSNQPFTPRGNTSDTPIVGNTSNTPRLAPDPSVPAPPTATPRALEAPPAAPRSNIHR